MTVEANSKPPIHQRNDEIGLGAVAIRVECSDGHDLTVTCDSSPSTLRKAGLSSEAELLSRYTVAFGCWRRIDAGAMGLISPSKHAFTACALRWSGTTAGISLALRIWRSDIQVACVGIRVLSTTRDTPIR